MAFVEGETFGDLIERFDRIKVKVVLEK